jgi:hypothetical protein
VVFIGCGDTGTGLTGAGPGDGLWRAATNTVRGVRANQLRFQFDGPESAEVTELEGFWGAGDSGCPAFMEVDERLVVAGVSSHGFDSRADGIFANYGEGDVSYRVSHYAPWIREVMQAQAASPRTIGEPQAVVDGQLPATPVGELASAYFDARTSDADMRAAFVDQYVQLPEDAARDAVERRIWIGGRLPSDLGPYTLLEYVVQPDDSIVVSTTVPQIGKRLIFTLRHGKDEPIMLLDVRVLPVPR